MNFARTIILLAVPTSLGACVSPETNLDSRSIDHHNRIQGDINLQPHDASFPVAAPPRYDADDRTQQERDLEIIGRKG